VTLLSDGEYKNAQPNAEEEKDHLRPALLEALGIEKSYGGVRALKNVSLTLYESEVHALVGENGAGKSSLIKVLSGAVQADAGEIRLRGERLHGITPAKARALGISVIYQQPALFPDLSVTENIALAAETAKPWHRVDWKKRRAHAAELLERIGARIRPEKLAGDLSIAEQQIVEIVKALDANACVLIMDEPTAALGNEDSENLFRIVFQLRAKGTSIVYITHRFEELFRLADRVTVLRDGNSIGTREMRGVTNQELIRMMVGREVENLFPKHEPKLGSTALEVRNVKCKRLGVENVSLSIQHGEILGLAGLIGSGRTQLAEALFGLATLDSGQILIDGKRVEIQSPSDAVDVGLAYVPEDRRRHGVILEMPISANVTLASLGRISSSGLLRFRTEEDIAQQFKERLGVKAPSIETPAKELSGGNQQKVALARWLMTDPKILILDEPTQGIDVGAKAEIHRLIGELAEKGLAILMISSEMPELLAMCDRIAVMAKGKTVGLLDRKEATPDAILELALGHNRTGEGDQLT
jgi:rhamnose transport system ATP-binding protein